MVRSDFATLDPDQEASYARVRDTVAKILAEDPDNGLMYLLNAIVLQDDHNAFLTEAWATRAVEGHLDTRDLVGVIHERPLRIPLLDGLAGY